MESFVFHLDLLTGHELCRVCVMRRRKQCGRVCFGALCPEGRLALMADICAFWRGPSGFSRWKDLSFPEAPSGLRRRQESKRTYDD